MNNTTEAPTLGQIAYKGFDDYWTEGSRGIDAEAWEASAQAVRAALAQQAATPPAAEIVGDTRFEGWLSCHEPDRTDGRSPRYTKQDMRDCYWAGYCERQAATPAPAEPVAYVHEPTDARCDAILADAMSRTAAVHGMSPEDVNPNVQTHPTLGRTIVRTAWETCADALPPLAWVATVLWNRRETWACPADIEAGLRAARAAPPATPAAQPADEVAQRLIGLAEKMMRDSWATGDDAAWRPGRAALESAIRAALEGDGWIAVADRLPEKETDVLCARRFGGMHLPPIVAAQYDGRWYSYDDDETEESRVTHWRPLPAAPSEWSQQ